MTGTVIRPLQWKLLVDGRGVSASPGAAAVQVGKPLPQGVGPLSQGVQPSSQGVGPLSQGVEGLPQGLTGAVPGGPGDGPGWAEWKDQAV